MEFTEELLELLWVLEATINLQPEGATLLAEVSRSELFSSDELPKPSDEERQAPRNAPVRRGAGLTLPWGCRFILSPSLAHTLS